VVNYAPAAQNILFSNFSHRGLPHASVGLTSDFFVCLIFCYQRFLARVVNRLTLLLL